MIHSAAAFAIAVFGFAAEVSPAIPGAGVSIDLDGDGVLDRAFIAAGEVMIDLDGEPHALGVGASALATCDVDCDGRLDLVIDGGASWVANSTLLAAMRGEFAQGGVAGDPEGLAYAPVWDSIETTLENSTRHLVADLDGDGASELVTADYNGPFGRDVATLRIFSNMSDDQWTEVWSFADGPRVFTGMAAADIDHDGAIELLAGKIGGTYGGTPYVGPRVYVFQSDGRGGFELDHLIEVDPAVSAFTWLDDIAVGDANGDGRLDVAVGVADNETALTPVFGTKIKVFTFDERSRAFDEILSHTSTNLGLGYVTAIDVGDSDHDGEQEVIFFDRVSVSIKRFEHDDEGFVLKVASTGIGPGVCMDAMIGDADGDGEAEIACGAQSGSAGHLYVLHAVADDAYAVAFADAMSIGNTVLYVAIDDSEKPPLLAGASHSSDVLVVAYDNAARTFQTMASFTVPEAEQLHEISIRRMDGDCKRDLMITQFRGTGDSGVYEQREVAAEAGDIDCSGAVDAADLAMLLGAWSLPPDSPGCSANPAPRGPCAADLNSDGHVNAADLAMLLGAWTG